ncbi:MAG TPA: hypothetical protein VKA55_03855 [Gammaproteobacteria bacterium]|nr:hypothetical protein [Gammaproteobacteria bacterium]
MDLATFTDSLGEAEPPAGLSRPLQALWWAGRGDWGRAHGLAQAAPGPEAAWVHAHLHREEGDLGNANFWYSRAGRPMSGDSLEQEWRAIAAELLAGRGR